MDPRREANHIHREFNKYHKYIGESVLWFQFDTSYSQYDDVYDEAYRSYLPAAKVPVLWVDQQEAAKDYAAEGRRPTQRIRFAVDSKALWECGIQVTEAHGNRISDSSPSTVWREDRLNDLIYYDARFYAISNFQIRGRVQGEDVILGVSGIETFPTDELNMDNVPATWFPAV
jgi:hypothetical protein